MMKDRVVNFLPFHLDVLILFFIHWNMEIQVFLQYDAMFNGK
jgi:hypothetical protein